MNNADEAAEFVEGRGPAKGNAEQTPESRTPSRTDSMTGLQRVRAAASREKNARFTALLHHVTLELLRDSYRALKRDATPVFNRAESYRAAGDVVRARTAYYTVVDHLLAAFRDDRLLQGAADGRRDDDPAVLLRVSPQVHAGLRRQLL